MALHSKEFSKPTIFMGSNNNSFGLVQCLARRIRELDLAIPIEWSAERYSSPDYTLKKLLEMCSDSDFAVLFLIHDSTSTDHALDSALFETGLFVGGLGLEPQRCILVSSYDLQWLPDTMQGVNRIEIEEPPSGGINRDWCLEHMQKVFQYVDALLADYPRLYKRPFFNHLTAEQIVEKQSNEMELSRNDTVVITTSDPSVWFDAPMVQRIAGNLEKGVKYHLHASFIRSEEEKQCSQCAECIEKLIIALCCDQNPGTTEQVSKAIRTVKNNVRIFAHLNPEPFPFEVVLYNALSAPESRTCYIQHENSCYVECDRAEKVLDCLKYKSCDADNGTVFQGSTSIGFYDTGNSTVPKEALEEGHTIKKLVISRIQENTNGINGVDFRKELIQACFGEDSADQFKPKVNCR